MGYADVEEDFAPRFPRELTEAETERAATLLEDASFWLGVWVPGLDKAIDAGNEKAATAAKLLAVAMVRRAMLAPAQDTGVANFSLGAGRYTGAVTYRNPEGNLYLYQRELDALLSIIRDNSADAFSMLSPGGY